MKHYLITRFNIHEPTWKANDLSGAAVCDDEWMEHRFELFERYCLPSVRAQTTRFFRWVLMFHTDTSDRWRMRIQGMVPEAKVLLCGRHWLKELQTWVGLDCDTPHVLTTRLDNDDVISPDYLRMVQVKAPKERFHFIDHPVGYRLSGGQLFNHLEACNPFLSLVEETKRVQTVLSIPHGRAVRRYPVTTGSREPMWCQVIHDRNYSNFQTVGGPIDPAGWIGPYLSR